MSMMMKGGMALVRLRSNICPSPPRPRRSIEVDAIYLDTSQPEQVDGAESLPNTMSDRFVTPAARNAYD